MGSKWGQWFYSHSCSTKWLSRRRRRIINKLICIQHKEEEEESVAILHRKVLYSRSGCRPPNTTRDLGFVDRSYLGPTSEVGELKRKRAVRCSWLLFGLPLLTARGLVWFGLVWIRLDCLCEKQQQQQSWNTKMANGTKRQQQHNTKQTLLN